MVQTPFDDEGGQFSPDGRWVAYQSNASRRVEIYVQPFPGLGGTWQVSTTDASQRWRPDGKELFYIAPDARLMVSRYPPTTVTTGQHAQLQPHFVRSEPMTGEPHPVGRVLAFLAPLLGRASDIRPYCPSRDRT